MNKYQFSGSYIEKTDTLLTLLPTNKTYVIGDSLDMLLPNLSEGGIILWRDINIEDLFGDDVFCDDAVIRADYYRFNFTQNPHKKIIEDAQELQVYAEYDIGPALRLLDAFVRTDVVNHFCNGVIVYLKKRINGTLQRLSLYKLGGYRVNVSEVDPSAQLPIGRGVLLSG